MHCNIQYSTAFYFQISVITVSSFLLYCPFYFTLYDFFDKLFILRLFSFYDFFILRFFSFYKFLYSAVGTVVPKAIKTRVRESIRDIICLCRLRAIAKLRQYDSAKKDAILLLPIIFADYNEENNNSEGSTVQGDRVNRTIVGK